MYFNSNFYISECLGFLHLGFGVLRLFLGSFMGFWDWIYEYKGDTRSSMGFRVSPGVSLGI